MSGSPSKVLNVIGVYPQKFPKELLRACSSMVERFPFKEKVEGSIPSRLTKKHLA